MLSAHCSHKSSVGTHSLCSADVTVAVADRSRGTFFNIKLIKTNPRDGFDLILIEHSQPIIETTIRTDRTEQIYIVTDADAMLNLWKLIVMERKKYTRAMKMEPISRIYRMHHSVTTQPPRRTVRGALKLGTPPEIIHGVQRCNVLHILRHCHIYI